MPLYEEVKDSVEISKEKTSTGITKPIWSPRDNRNTIWIMCERAYLPYTKNLIIRDSLERDYRDQEMPLVSGIGFTGPFDSKYPFFPKLMTVLTGG